MSSLLIDLVSSLDRLRQFLLSLLVGLPLSFGASFTLVNLPQVASEDPTVVVAAVTQDSGFVLAS